MRTLGISKAKKASFKRMVGVHENLTVGTLPSSKTSAITTRWSWTRSRSFACKHALWSAIRNRRWLCSGITTLIKPLGNVKPCAASLSQKSAFVEYLMHSPQALQSGICTVRCYGRLPVFSRYRTDCGRVDSLISEDDVKNYWSLRDAHEMSSKGESKNFHTLRNTLQYRNWPFRRTNRAERQHMNDLTLCHLLLQKQRQTATSFT